MEPKKTVEEKLAEKYVTRDRTLEAVRKIQHQVSDLSAVPELTDIVFNTIMSEEIFGLIEEVGNRKFSFHLFHKKIANLVKPYLLEYIEQHHPPTKITVFK